MESIWSKSVEIGRRKSLQNDISTEIAVIGAGMAGILTAHALSDAGHCVVVLEANEIGSGQTKNTTAKITARHGAIYQRLIEAHGKAKAMQYASANELAVDEYKKLIKAKSIDCDFEECSAYTYGYDEAFLKAEINASKMLGIQASFKKDTPLPFKTAGAVEFKNSAQFNPLKFLKTVSEPLTIYEHTPVISVDGDIITTGNGATVKARKIVFACHYPFINFPGMFFTKMHQERSYVLALKDAPHIDGMWIGAGKNSYSFRSYGDFLLLGGGGHRTGKNSEGDKYEKLLRKANQWYPESSVTAFWSAQDCITPDSVPYIGRYCKSEPNWYIATGFQKWGMTSSMVSAVILKDLIEGRQNAFSEVFDPSRFNLQTACGVASETGQAVKGLSKRIFAVSGKSISDIKKGHGGIVSAGGEKIGIYKDAEGKIYKVNIKCPHLGCQLEWNPDEKSWDCPCHGSRFDRFGRLISNPSQSDITHK